jgi:cytochrome P450
MTTDQTRRPLGPAVPPAADFDHHDTTADAARVRARYEEVRDACPVAHVDRHGGFELVSGYPEIREVTAARDAWSSAGDGIFIPPSGLPPVPALEFDGAEHRRWRKVFDGLLSPSAVRAVEPAIVETVDAHLDAVAGRGAVDLVPTFTHPVPGVVIGRLVGLSVEESVRSQELADAFFSSLGTDAFAEHFGAFVEFTLGHLHDRRRHPRGDVLSELAGGRYGGMDIDDEVAVQIFVALLVGGHHSTASGRAGLVHHVLTHDDVRARLPREPDLVARAVDESLRLTTPLQTFARTAVGDTEVGGCPVGAGGRILLNFAAANRDPREFARPGEFDVDRARNRHLAFGHGAHVCVGQHLARLELRVALTRLLVRLPDLALDGEPEFTGLVAGQLMAIRSLPVRFTPTR